MVGLYHALVIPSGAALGVSHSPGRSPNLAQIGGWVLVADSRLDNRDELRQLVGTPPQCTDAYLLLAMWLRDGENSLARIAGDFAIAVFDPGDRALSLARDVTGQRPLFYTKTDFGVAFASMPAGLRPAIPDFELDRSSLALVAMDLPLAAGESFFNGVNSVGQAEVICFSPDGAVARDIYWAPSLKPSDHGDRHALVEEYRHVLDEAVRPRLRDSSAVVATHLSGGFDSSSVTATAARLLGDPQRVIGFTSAPAFRTPPEQEFGFFAEESELAGDVAAMYGFQHVVVRETAPIGEVLHSQTSFLQQPVRDPFNGAWWSEVERRAAAMGACSLLTGELGNLTINAGNLTVLSEWLRRRRWTTWVKQARAASRRPDVSWRGVLYNSFGPWIPRPVSSAFERIFLGYRPHGFSFVRREWQSLSKEQPAKDFYAERLAIIRSSDSGNLRKAALAQFGIDEIDPFSDRRLIEFAFRIPPDQLYWNGVQRPLMRTALSDRLPASLFNKHGRGLQSADWAIRLSQADAFALLEELSASRVAQDLLDLDQMERVIERWPTRNWNEPSIAQEFRLALFDAIGVGVFAAIYG